MLTRNNVVHLPGTANTRVVSSPKSASKNAISLTKTIVKKLELPPGKDDIVFWDNSLAGFGLRIRKGGKRVFVAQFRDEAGATRRVTIGSTDVLEADEARAQAKKLLGGVAIGNDPAKAKKEARLAVKFGEMLDKYLAHAKDKQEASTLEATTRNLRTHSKGFHTTALREIGRIDIAELHGKITKKNGPVQANRVLASLSGYFAFLVARGQVETNPVNGVPKNVEKGRERVLTDDELRAIWKGTESGSDYDRIIRVLLLTGLRRSEVGSMRWEEVAGDLWTIPGERMKNGLAHEVALTESALAALPEAQDKGFVFGKEMIGERRGYSGWSRSKGRLDGRLKIADWGLHDFRRTMSTKLHDAGVEPHIVEALLAHISGHKGGVAGTYNKAAYRTQKRAALTLWAGMIDAIIKAGP
ncbi:tyrosine-type recombinase/integrase [Rhizobium sp. RAF56]|uniref:tyrosine-type recombinase/integrase n=1 Tax=Rhizobium sp. RAF56 TaxID=3233062 RepID=UPI003F9BB742